MRISMLVLTLVAALFTSAAIGSQDTEATRIIQRYLKIPHPKGDKSEEARLERLQTLAELKAMPKEAVSAIGRALPEVKDSRQRVELVEVLGEHLQTKESAALLCELLNDPDRKVRWQAVDGLSRMAKRTGRSGAKRVIRGPDFAPKVEGLVPYLISAADDKVEGNRVGALYALVDTCDPSAVSELRNRLKDPSEKVRLYAACFLTEYQDAAGLPEMRDALARFRRTRPADILDYYWQVEKLLASFERITGKSFGEMPPDPYVCSDGRRIPDIEKRYKALLDTWAEWWAWEPKAGEK
ncbi:MAG: HEAT repeat domain-containing protein [Planctomycetota bacterium]|jgi:HEAT repeat protein